MIQISICIKEATRRCPGLSSCVPIHHQDVTSFHLSYQPPLYVMCRYLVIRMGLFSLWVSAIGTLLLHILILQKWNETCRGGWWLKWKLIPCLWRNAPACADLFTFADYFQKLRCVSRMQCATTCIGISFDQSVISFFWPCFSSSLFWNWRSILHRR